jgi:acyl-CoA thioesterase I
MGCRVVFLLAPLMMIVSVSCVSTTNHDRNPASVGDLGDGPCAHLPVDEKEKLLQDFAQLCRYEKENSMLAPHQEKRVVLIGDSITDFWKTDDPNFFSVDNVCRGISGQTTSQMLLRFRADVLNLRPRVVHILAGTNDIAGNTGATTPERIQGNIKSMVELARAHHIKVMLGSLLPAKAYPWSPQVRPEEAIRAMNVWLKTYAEKTDSIYVDYYSAMNDGAGGLRKDLSPDGVHPNPAGYAIMRPIFDSALATISPR